MVLIWKYWYFSYFSMKTYVVSTQQKRLNKALLISTCKYVLLREIYITKTCLYNFDPIKPHFYIFWCLQGYTFFSYFCSRNIDYGYSLKLPRRGGSNEYTKSMFWAEIWKILEFFIWKFSFFGGKIFSIFEKACFRNEETIFTGCPFLSGAIRNINKPWQK